MLLDPLFSPFLAASPLSVMARSLIEHTLAPTDLDRLFEDHAKKQYTRKVTFSSLVELISLVVCGKQPSVCSVYQTNPGSVAASLTAVYNKLHGIKDSISTRLVEQTAERLSGG